MLPPTMSQFGINFVTDKGYPSLMCPECKRFHIGPIKHTAGWITWSVHEQDARIGTLSASLIHRLPKDLRRQTMTIIRVSLHADHPPPGQACHWGIADP